jgi:hypothetical protein
MMEPLSGNPDVIDRSKQTLNVGPSGFPKTKLQISFFSFYDKLDKMYVANPFKRRLESWKTKTTKNDDGPSGEGGVCMQTDELELNSKYLFILILITTLL